MMNIDKLHYQVTVFKLNKLGPNTNGESSVFLIKHGFESLPAGDSVS